MAKIVTFEVDLATAESKISTNGFQGKGCEAIVKKVLADQGDTTSAISHTREYNAPTLTSNRLNQGK
jgi:hypothetical protein